MSEEKIINIEEKQNSSKETSNEGMMNRPELPSVDELTEMSIQTYKAQNGLDTNYEFINFDEVREKLFSYINDGKNIVFPNIEIAHSAAAIMARDVEAMQRNNIIRFNIYNTLTSDFVAIILEPVFGSEKDYEMVEPDIIHSINQEVIKENVKRQISFSQQQQENISNNSTKE